MERYTSWSEKREKYIIDSSAVHYEYKSYSGEPISRLARISLLLFITSLSLSAAVLHDTGTMLLHACIDAEITEHAFQHHYKNLQNFNR